MAGTLVLTRKQGEQIQVDTGRQPLIADLQTALESLLDHCDKQGYSLPEKEVDELGRIVESLSQQTVIVSVAKVSGKKVRLATSTDKGIRIHRKEAVDARQKKKAQDELARNLKRLEGVA